MRDKRIDRGPQVTRVHDDRGGRDVFYKLETFWQHAGSVQVEQPKIDPGLETSVNCGPLGRLDETAEAVALTPGRVPIP